MFVVTTRPVLASAFGVVVLLGTPALSAQPAPTGLPDAPQSALEIGVEAYALRTFGNACKKNGDLVSCSSGTGALGLALVPRWRVHRLLSVGALAAYGSKPSVESEISSNGDTIDHTTRFWRLAAEGRLHPFRTHGSDPWAALEAGVGALSDISDTTRAGQPVATAASTQWAPCIGGGIGVDFYLGDRVALGVEGRGLVLFFGRNPAGYATGATTSYSTQPGAWFAVSATLLPSL